MIRIFHTSFKLLTLICQELVAKNIELVRDNRTSSELVRDNRTSSELFRIRIFQTFLYLDATECFTKP